VPNGYGEAIRKTEAEVDRTATEGDLEALKTACEAWMGAWGAALDNTGVTGAHDTKVADVDHPSVS